MTKPTTNGSDPVLELLFDSLDAPAKAAVAEVFRTGRVYCLTTETGVDILSAEDVENSVDDQPEVSS